MARGVRATKDGAAPRAKRVSGETKPAAKKIPTAKTVEDRPAYYAPALEKGLDVLELLSTLSAPVTPSQIAQMLGRSLQEVYRVVLALERRGYLVRPPGEEALILSTHLFGLATLYPPFRRVVDVAQPIMNALALESYQAIHMAVLDGLNQRIIAQVDSPAAIAVRLRVGAASPAIRATSGRTLVAFQTPGVQDWIFREAERNNPSEQMEIARHRIGRIREHGYEMIDGEVLKDVTDICFPIRNGAGIAMAAITMPFLHSPIAMVPFETASRQLYDAAERITRVVGGEMPVVSFPLTRP